MRTAMLFVVGIFISSSMSGQISKSNQYDLVVGTYSNKDKNNGILVYAFNSTTGEFSFKSKIDNIKNPSYLAISADKKNLYSVSEAGAGTGSVYAYAFDVPSGKLEFLNNVSSGGDGPCYVSVDAKKKYVFVGNYSGGSLSATAINADGSFSKDTQIIQNEGSSVVKERQDKPHVHSAVLSPDDRYLLVPDLGTDKVNIYEIDNRISQPMKPGAQPFAAVKAGGGPRHITFHPNGKFAYLILEMEGAIVAFSFNNGKLETLQSITMLSDGFSGKVGAADIHISPDGKFLYGSNRGDANEIVVYAIDKNGKLRYAGRQSTLGKTPRNFAIDPSGNYLLAANQGSDEVIIFKRDATTGLLSPSGNKISVDKPVCLKLVAVD